MKKMSIAIKSKKEMAQVGTVASNNDTEIGDLLAESLSKFFFRNVSIFDSVVQNRGDQNIEIADIADVSQKVRNLQRVVYIRFAVTALTFLVCVEF